MLGGRKKRQCKSRYRTQVQDESQQITFPATDLSSESEFTTSANELEKTIFKTKPYVYLSKIDNNISNTEMEMNPEEVVDPEKDDTLNSKKQKSSIPKINYTEKDTFMQNKEMEEKKEMHCFIDNKADTDDKTCVTQKTNKVNSNVTKCNVTKATTSGTSEVEKSSEDEISTGTEINKTKKQLAESKKNIHCVKKRHYIKKSLRERQIISKTKAKARASVKIRLFDENVIENIAHKIRAKRTCDLGINELEETAEDIENLEQNRKFNIATENETTEREKEADSIKKLRNRKRLRSKTTHLDPTELDQPRKTDTINKSKENPEYIFLNNEGMTPKQKNDKEGIYQNYKRKKNFCKFCKTLRTNVARHFEICHSDSTEVQAFLMLEKKSKKRAELLTRLRNQGNFEYNTSHPRNLILTRARHVYDCPNDDFYFLPCPLCKGFFSHRYISCHYKKCSNMFTEKGTVRTVKRDAKCLIEKIHPLANHVLRYKVMPPMRSDELFQIIKRDQLIILFGNFWTPKYIGHQEYIVRHRMRLLARYFVHIKSLAPNIVCLKQIFHPKNFEVAIKGIFLLARLDYNTGTYATPKIALEMTHYLKLCSDILSTQYIKEENEMAQSNVQKFKQLLKTEAAGRINKPAHRDLLSKRRNNTAETLTIPITEDIKKFKDFLLHQAEIVFKKLTTDGFSYVLWKRLSELCLLYIVVFNRKRSGESHRISIDDYKSIHPLTKSTLSELYEELPDIDKKAARSIYKLLIRGKLDRTVPAFVPKRLKGFLDYIYESRSQANVLPQNPYFFGLPGMLSGQRFKCLETCLIMRKYTQMAGLKKPEIIRTTLLRKHLATKVSTLNLGDANQETVQNFMGHNEKVHKTIYRQQVIKKDLLMANILRADGTRSKMWGVTDEEENRKKKITEESTVDSENAEIFERNRRLIENTPPKKRFPRSKKMQNRPNKYGKSYLPDKDGSDDDPFADSSSEDSVGLELKSCVELGEKSTSTDDTYNEPKKLQGVSDRDLISASNYITSTGQRTRWTQAAKAKVHTLFNAYIKQGVYPPSQEIQRAINNIEELKGRTVSSVKSFLQAQMKTLCSSLNRV